MELFTLGADRGAYTEADVRELARALTGWRADWTTRRASHNFRFDPNRHDDRARRCGRDRLRATRRVQLAGRLQARPRPPAAPLVLRAQAVVVLHPDSARRQHAGRARGALRSQRLLDPAGRRGDPPAPRLLHRAARWSSRRSSTSPGCCAPPAGRSRHDAWVWLAADTPASALLSAERGGLERPRLAGHVDRLRALVRSPPTRSTRRSGAGSWASRPRPRTQALGGRDRRWGNPPLAAETYARAARVRPAAGALAGGRAPPDTGPCARTRCASSSPPPPTPSSRDALMADCCDDFTRSHLLRGSIARAGSGLPADRAWHADARRHGPHAPLGAAALRGPGACRSTAPAGR